MTDQSMDCPSDQVVPYRAALDEAIARLTERGETESGPQGGVSGTYPQAVRSGFTGHLGRWHDRIYDEMVRLAGDPDVQTDPLPPDPVPPADSV